MLRGMATVSCYADDLTEATRWYSELLGIEPYYQRPGPDGTPGYVEFRIGDYQHELGLIKSSWKPPAAAAGPGGAVLHWHVDDVEATVERLLSMGAKEYTPITSWGDKGFVTASVIDPFGNVLGVMYNPHYVEVLGGR
jgi:predicted enzyme related to lactoylglutathione lyase